MTAWLPSWRVEEDIFNLPRLLIRCCNWSRIYFNRKLKFCFVSAAPCLHRFEPKLIKVAAILTCLFLMLLPLNAFASNLTIENAEMASIDEDSDTIVIEFDLSWENAWNYGGNYDAAWVFVKYSTDAGTTWFHATMNDAGLNPTGFADGSPQATSKFTSLDILVPSDLKGCFFQPKAPTNSYGISDFHDVQIVWDYGANNVSDAAADGANVRVKVFGIEMTYVPTGSFYAGDTSQSSQNYGELRYGGSSSTTPGLVSSENELSFSTTSSTWYYTSDPGGVYDDASGTTFTVPSSYPKGYNAFYLMKYEISEQQYCEFFNTLTSTQKTARDITSSTGKNSDSTVSRNTISWTGSGDMTTTRPDRSCSYLSWMDLAAYLDWSALRPMSELEYEKACRGTVYPVRDEYPWHNTSKTNVTTITGTENGTEVYGVSSANIHFGNTTLTGGDGGTGPIRVGGAARTSSTTAYTSGGGYYGNMDMAGNLWEFTVTLGNSYGRAFTGTHGDGGLTTLSGYTGNASNSDWPGIDPSAPRGVTGASGTGRRGASWYQTNTQYATVSGRYYGGTPDTTRKNEYGGRGARSAAS